MKCTVSFADTTTIINFMKQVITLDYCFPIDQRVVDGIILAIQTARLCNGVPVDGKLPKMFIVEKISSLQNPASVTLIGRSEQCKKSFYFLAKLKRVRHVPTLIINLENVLLP